nr:hypothetical protein GCM10020063_002390 [Dactylosporangium thailandense]
MPVRGTRRRFQRWHDHRYDEGQRIAWIVGALAGMFLILGSGAAVMDGAGPRRGRRRPPPCTLDGLKASYSPGEGNRAVTVVVWLKNASDAYSKTAGIAVFRALRSKIKE